MSSDVAIRVDRLSKTFRIYEKPEHRLLELVSFGRVQRHREFAALKDVSLEIHRGETVGIVGRNGCGKSTLLQVICGILQPTAGTVQTHGRIAALLELGAGFDGNFTGRENVYLNGAIHGCTSAEMDERFEAIAAFADIGEFLDQPVRTYSSGMFVRLAFATAVNVDPDILVVDEALAVGDEAFQRKCFARIERIRERGATILFVSHAAQTIIQLCDRAVLMDAGEKLMEGRPKEVVVTYQRLSKASPAHAKMIRSEIRADITASSDRGSVVVAAEETATRDEQPAASDYFDPELIVKSPVRFEERGAAINNVRVQRISGGVVNLLQPGVRYALTYDVQFSEDALDVGFSYSFRTTEGLALTGLSTYADPRHRLHHVARGTTAVVEFEFSAVLRPGVYFVSCSVRGRSNGDPKIFQQVQDIAMFRILPDENRLSIFHVDIGSTYSVNISKSSMETVNDTD